MLTGSIYRNVLDKTLFIGTLWDRDRPTKDCPADHHLCYLRIVLLGDVKEDRIGEKRLAQTQGCVCGEDNTLLLTVLQEPFLR